MRGETRLRNEPGAAKKDPDFLFDLEPAPQVVDEGKVHARNQLNHLTGKQWIRFTRSWFVHNPVQRSASQVQHPAKFPETLAREFIEFFTQRGQVVLDPFMGVGSTLLAAGLTGRQGIGTELNEKYYNLARQHLGLLADQHRLFHADASEIPSIFRREGLEPVDFLFTSPPYWDMLGQSRGNVLSVHKKRQAKGLDDVYSRDDPRDLGNISVYEEFVQRLADLFGQVTSVLKVGGFAVVVIQNLRNREGRMVRLAWDLTDRLDRFLVFKGERIWCQDNKQLGIWGYPSEFVTNIHHHYCLVFKKEQKS